MTEKNEKPARREALATAADAAAFIERKAEDYAREFGTNDMGSLSFGNEDMRIYHWHLVELSDEIRALAAPPQAAPVAQESEAEPFPIGHPKWKGAFTPSASAQQAEPMPGAPERIYLVVGEDIEKGDNFNDLDEVCWCADSQFDTDIEYVRADLAAPAPSASPVRSISDDMMDLVDRLGSQYAEVDPRAWQHLLVYAPKPGASPVALTLDANDVEFLAARLRRLFNHFKYLLPDFAKDDKHLIGIAPTCIGAVLANLNADEAKLARGVLDDLARKGLSATQPAAGEKGNG